MKPITYRRVAVTTQTRLVTMQIGFDAVVSDINPGDLEEIVWYHGEHRVAEDLANQLERAYQNVLSKAKINVLNNEVFKLPTVFGPSKPDWAIRGPFEPHC